MSHPAVQGTPTVAVLSGQPDSERCKGSATPTLSAGERILVSAKVRLDSRCRYRKTFTVRRDRLGTRTRLTLSVRSRGALRSTVKLTP